MATVDAISRIRNKYPNHVPVFITKYEKCILPNLKKNKFLVPKDFAMGHILVMIRKNINLQPSEAIFVYVCTPTDSLLASSSDSISTVFDRYHQEDGMLHLTYTAESVFGAGMC